MTPAEVNRSLGMALRRLRYPERDHFIVTLAEVPRSLEDVYLQVVAQPEGAAA